MSTCTVHDRVKNGPDAEKYKATENQPSDIYIEPTKKYRTNHSPQAHSTLKRWGRVGQELGPAEKLRSSWRQGRSWRRGRHWRRGRRWCGGEGRRVCEAKALLVEQLAVLGEHRQKVVRGQLRRGFAGRGFALGSHPWTDCLGRGKRERTPARSISPHMPLIRL